VSPWHAFCCRSGGEPTGGAGFLLVDYDDPHEVTAFLQPFMDLMSFDVRAVYQLDYKERIEELRKVATQST
jgi:Domain of unknown function (DUF3303)